MNDLLQIAKECHDVMVRAQVALRKVAVDLEDGRPVLAYKQLAVVSRILYESQERLSGQFPHQL